MRVEVEDQMLRDGPPRRSRWTYYLFCWRVTTNGRYRRSIEVIVGKTKREANARLRRFMNQKHVTLMSDTKARRVRLRARFGT